MAAIVTPTLARFGVCEKTLVSLFSRFILVATRHVVSRIFPDALINEGIYIPLLLSFCEHGIRDQRTGLK